MQHRIIVLGAGYAGAITAGRLAKRLRREDVSITLVNASPEFVERVRNHQVAAGGSVKPRPLTAMFADTGVALRIASVTAVDVSRKTVSLTDGELSYDTLVYALGSAANGTPEHAYELAGRPGAQRLRERLATLSRNDTVLVVGGGLTGIEAVTEIAEARPDLDVAVATRGAFGDWLSPKGRAHLRKVTNRLGIAVHENVAVDRVGAGHVELADGRTLPAAVTVWTGGFAVHPLAAATSLELGPDGRIVVDGTMRSVSHPDVYAVGDSALAMGAGDKAMRMACASGVPQAWQAADSIAARLTGGKLPNAPLKYFNQCISLGRGDGLIQFVTEDDVSRPGVVTGRAAAIYKEMVVKGAYWGVANPMLRLPVRRRAVTREPAAVSTMD
ncbi:NAD(P)/FAD-dependent oxidoreductase [Actinoplanes sp. NPDC000266]